MHAVGLARTEGAEGTVLQTSLHGRDSERAISLHGDITSYASAGRFHATGARTRHGMTRGVGTFSIFNFQFSILMYNFAK